MTLEAKIDLYKQFFLMRLPLVRENQPLPMYFWHEIKVSYKIRSVAQSISWKIIKTYSTNWRKSSAENRSSGYLTNYIIYICIYK